MKKSSYISLMDIVGQYRLVEKEVLPVIERVLISGRYIQGPEVEIFEKEFAEYCGARFCIGTSSGTDSLLITLRALGVGPKDEVITVPNTFTATAEAIYLTGAKVVFCDIDNSTMNLDPDKLKNLITSRTRAIIPVHLHGNPARIDEISDVIKDRNIAIIEDAAQAHGAYYKGKKIGSLQTTATAFSFHPVKNLGAYGDAGAITTNDARLDKKIRRLINHGRVSHIKHEVAGTTARLDAIQAAVLSVKLLHLNSWILKKRKLVDYYLLKLPPQCQPIQQTPESKSGLHVFAVLVPKRNKLVEYLEKKKIETGMHYGYPLHLQKAYAFLGHKKGDFPNAEYYASHTISLPLFPHMTLQEVDRVVTAISNFYEKI